MPFNFERSLETIKKCKPLPENDMKALCRIVKSILVEDSNVARVPAPVTVCGDVHGQFHDVLELFKTGGEIPHTSYIFMGDFVDRGYYSLETLTLLLLMKARYPSNITLLRGNHESRAITQIYGFYDECQRKYGSSVIWQYCCEVFDCMNISAVVDGRLFCVHGGLSPDIKTIDQIRCIERRVEIPHEGAFCDLVWSDPENIETWNVSQRGAGWLFGSRVTNEYNHLNGLDLIARAHQLMQEGYMFHFEKKNLVTVWSAPNYCFRCGNLASVMAVDSDLNTEFKVFKETIIDHNVNNPTNQPVFFV